MVLGAGRLNKNSLGSAVLLCTGLLLAGCSSNSGSGTYSGSVYTVKRGDTLYRISRATGTSEEAVARIKGV
ncbi:LysM peptidoglycan-binding domain-containing protein, partial [Salmonella enterica]|uniref:LysM peptidoglycan-binding domain-containing protein n=1 Tax=Salmonella enterica TaxID=28901 RepID=UPI003BBA5406